MKNMKKKRKESVASKNRASHNKSDARIVIPAIELFFDGAVKTIKYNEGVTSHSFTAGMGITVAARRILNTLVELMILDVLEGKVVYFNKKLNSSFSVNHRPVMDSFFKGSSHENTKVAIPKLDVIKSGFKYPIVVFDPGREKDQLCLTVIPRVFYALLTDNINNGKTYPKSTKEYILNKLMREKTWDEKSKRWFK